MVGMEIAQIPLGGMDDESRLPKMEYEGASIPPGTTPAVWGAAQLLHSYFSDKSSPTYSGGTNHQCNFSPCDISNFCRRVYDRLGSHKLQRFAQNNHRCQALKGSTDAAQSNCSCTLPEISAVSKALTASAHHSHAGASTTGGTLRNQAGNNSKNKRKRKRNASDDGDRAADDGQQGSDDQNDPDDVDGSDVSSRQLTRLLACHFHKKDPFKFRGPGKFKACQNGFQGFNRLKQHLRTVHQPKSYCMGCESIFDSQDEKDNHDRTRGECERRRIEGRVTGFDEMITNDRQREALKRKLVSVQTSTHWFDMWECLNGNLTPPASPYKESSLDATAFVKFVKQRATSFADDYVPQANQELPLAQHLTNFTQSLLDIAAAEYLQQTLGGYSKQAPQPLVPELPTVPAMPVDHIAQTSDPAMLQQVLPADVPAMSPGLSATRPPKIIVTDPTEDLDFFNFDWTTDGDLEHYITWDPMLGTIYRRRGAQWLNPSADSGVFP